MGVCVVERTTSVAGQRPTMASSRPQPRILKQLSIHAVNAILNTVFGRAVLPVTDGIEREDC